MSTAAALLLLLVPLSGRGNDVVVQHLDGSGRVSLTGGAGNAAQPVWSPDGAQVAFVSAGRVYLVAADGSGLRALSPPELDASDPVWAPDGTQVAFLADPGGETDVWTEPASGGTPRRLTTSGGQKSGLAWAPDGSSILFGSATGGTAALFALDPVTGGSRKLADSGFPTLGPAGAWSPDGSQVAFADPQNRLAVMNADGTSMRVLEDAQIADLPAWSPDGTMLAYSARRALPGPPTRYGPYVAVDISTIDVHTGRLQRLTGPFDDVSPLPWTFVASTSPSWWPDASRLFFRHFDPSDSQTQLWQMNADGTCEQPIGTVAVIPAASAWQPGHAVAGGAVPCVDLRVRPRSWDGPLALRATAHASVVVENDGNEPATNVRVSPLSIHPALGDCAFAGCDLATIEPGGSRTVDTMVAGAKKPSVFTVVVSARADEQDLTPGDASVRIDFQVLNCTIAGTTGADVLIGTRGADRICGLPGPDRINGGRGNDYIDAGNGDDTIIGGPGRDTIIARGGRDVIYARDGQVDWIDCGTEYDIAVVDRVDHTSHCEKVLRR